jgi:hypothetical protein
MASTMNIQFHPCAKAKVCTTIVRLTEITTTRPTHPTINLALEQCENILITVTQTNTHLELGAREFLGYTKALFDHGATLEYSNASKTITYTLRSGNTNTLILSNHL